MIERSGIPGKEKSKAVATPPCSSSKTRLWRPAVMRGITYCGLVFGAGVILTRRHPIAGFVYVVMLIVVGGMPWLLGQGGVAVNGAGSH